MASSQPPLFLAEMPTPNPLSQNLGLGLEHPYFLKALLVILTCSQWLTTLPLLKKKKFYFFLWAKSPVSTKVVLFSLLRVIYVGRPQTSSRASDPLAGHVKTRIAGPTPWTSNLGSAVGLVLGHPPCELLRAAPCSAAFLRGSLLSSGMQ